ncbi:MAG: CAP domain-containing protein [Terracidiphilus sp.]|jgi:hypothetical protein
MDILRQGLVWSFALVVPVVLAQAVGQDGRRASIQPEAWQLVMLANQSRAAAGAGPLKWDPALAAAARQHCLRMAAQGSISHQYADEPDVSGRAGQAGAHFSLIEENVAFGPTPAAVHDGWMNSSGHRKNLLNPSVDRVGVAVVAGQGGLYAVADYEQAVPLLTQAQVEAAVAALVQASGIAVQRDPALARAACTMEQGMPVTKLGPQPRFVMRWQGADLSRLPQALVDRLASGAFREAAVGSCPPQGQQGSFTAYRVAVLLYSGV